MQNNKRYLAFSPAVSRAFLENYQLDFRPVAVSVFHMLVQVYKFVRAVGLPYHFGMLIVDAMSHARRSMDES